MSHESCSHAMPCANEFCRCDAATVSAYSDVDVNCGLDNGTMALNFES